MCFYISLRSGCAIPAVSLPVQRVAEGITHNSHVLPRKQDNPAEQEILTRDTVWVIRRLTKNVGALHRARAPRLYSLSDYFRSKDMFAAFVRVRTLLDIVVRISNPTAKRAGKTGELPLYLVTFLGGFLARAPQSLRLSSKKNPVIHDPTLFVVLLKMKVGAQGSRSC